MVLGAVAGGAEVGLRELQEVLAVEAVLDRGAPGAGSEPATVECRAPAA